jgi:hypothetical protein
VSAGGRRWMGLRLLAAGIAYLVCFVAAYGLVVRGTPPSPGAEPISPGLALLLASGLNTVVMGWLILRSRPTGWPLAAAMVLLFYGVQTFMPQVESLIFQANPGYASHLPAAVIPRLLLAGLLHAGLWIPLAVRLLGRWRPASPSPVPGGRPVLPAGWTWKLPLAALAYVAVYFTFGYYVAWRSPAVTAYYRGTDPGSFWAQIGSVLRDTPWLPAAQALRGLLWTALALVVVRITRATGLEKALATGVLFAVVMTSGLLLPNPYMPFEVRMVHLVETASSNFLFGALLVGLLGRGDAAHDPPPPSVGVDREP